MNGDSEIPDREAVPTDDAGQTPTDRKKVIERRLAETVSADLRMGGLAVLADALTDARALATEHPEMVAELVPEIVRTVIAAIESQSGKGRDVLPGAFGTRIQRDGMAALAVLTAQQMIDAELDDGERTDRISEVVEAVNAALADSGDVATTGYAIEVLGTLAIPHPEQVARLLTDEQTDAGTLAIEACLERVVNRADESELVAGVLRGGTILANHEATRPLVDDISHSLLGEVTNGDDTLVRAWCHVLCRELGRDSPLNPAQLWTKLEEQSNPDGLSRWLLAEYSADEVPALDSGDVFVTLLSQSEALASINEAHRLGDTFFETILPSNNVLASLEVVLDDTDEDIRQRAVWGLKRVASEETLSGEVEQRLVEAIITTLEDPNLAVRRRAVEDLADLVAENSLPSAEEVRVIEALETALEDPDDGVRSLAADGLREVATRDTLSTEVQQRVGEALVTALEYDDKGIQRRASEGLTKVAAENDVAIGVQRRLLDVLANTLEDNRGFVRRQALTSLRDAAAEEDLPREVRHRFINVSASVLEDTEYEKLREIAATGLAYLVGKENLSSKVQRNAVGALVDAAENENEGVRRCSAQGLRDVAAEKSLNAEAQQRVFRTLAIALEDADEVVRRYAAQGLKWLVTNESVSSETKQLVVERFGTTLEEADDEIVRTKAAEGLVNLPPGEDLSCERQQRVLETLLNALDHDSWDVRVSAAEGLRDLSSGSELSGRVERHVFETVLTGFEDERPSVQMAYLETIVDLVTEEDIPSEVQRRALKTLARDLEDDDKFVRQIVLDRVEEMVMCRTLTQVQARILLEGLQTVIDAEHRSLRQDAARNIRVCCEIHPQVAGEMSRLTTTIGRGLKPTELTVTRELLGALEALAADDVLYVMPVTHNIQRVLTAETPERIQIRALGVLSLTGASPGSAGTDRISPTD
jgi:HEAT repeat protein